MTDEMTTGTVPYQLPALCVRATYPATDGLVPEEIAIEFNGDGPIDPELVDRAVGALARVAADRGVRHLVDFDQPAAGVGWSHTDEALAAANRGLDETAGAQQ